VKLRHIEAYNEGRRRIARRYSELLADADVVTPGEPEDGSHVFHQYTLLSERRDEIMAALKEAGASSGIYYPIPLHRQSFCAYQYRDLRLPVTEETAERCFSLPMHPELSDTEVERIAGVVAEVVGS
jgi:dTDP-4-amino-4,6-dideoxygalactose transaminase